MDHEELAVHELDSSRDRDNPNAETEEEEEERCGIYLREYSSRAIRARIDGCTHRFCFVCIMEWAGTESRCPLCKQRFQSVRRPAVPGLLPAERVVKIPERDQVYHPLGVESTAINETHLDPHCSVCKSSANEAYLASCALCESTFHTSCAGLGTVIPETELHCSDCQICIEEYSKAQQPDRDDSRYADQETRLKIRTLRRGDESVSIEQIVADIRGGGRANAVPSNTHSAGRARHRRPMTDREQTEQCIQAFRANWSSVSFEDVARPYRGRESTRCQNTPAASNSNAGTKKGTRKSCDIKKSWKMLDKAMLHLPKKAPQQNVQQTSRSLSTIVKNPVYPEPKLHGDRASAFHAINQQSQLNRDFNQFFDSGYAPCASNHDHRKKGRPMHCSPLGASSRVPQMGPSLLARDAPSVKRERARLEDAKIEIQSMVKNSLSALPKDKKKLGTNGYKEVARVSTHTILSACGLEHNQDITVPPPSYQPRCGHSKNMSKSMLDTCRDCFNVFVRRVVGSVLQNKI